MGVHVVVSTGDFVAQLGAAGAKIVVVDFFADWCGPCKVVAPLYEQLSNRYTDAVFLKVNVDEQEEIARQYEITAMPTFVFFRSRAKVGQVRGSNMQAVESMLEEHSSAPTAGGASAAAAAEEVPAELLPGLLPGHIDLVESIDTQSECLNEADDHPFTQALHSGGGYLQSECDEQLILFLTFIQPVKLHTLQIQSPDNGHAPKTLRLFVNLPTTLDFDSAETNRATQEIVIKSGETTGNGLFPLQYVKFQNIQTLTVFVKDNLGGEETTIIDHFALFGIPVATTNMKDFKRVSGKAGEVHGH